MSHLTPSGSISYRRGNWVAKFSESNGKCLFMEKVPSKIGIPEKDYAYKLSPKNKVGTWGSLAIFLPVFRTIIIIALYFIFSYDFSEVRRIFEIILLLKWHIQIRYKSFYSENILQYWEKYKIKVPTYISIEFVTKRLETFKKIQQENNSENANLIKKTSQKKKIRNKQ